jgi:hypothetical protein
LLRKIVGEAKADGEAARALAGLRGKLAHGSGEAATLLQVENALHLIQELVVQGFANVLGVANKPLILLPGVSYISLPQNAIFDAVENPMTRWNGYLSDVYV